MLNLIKRLIILHGYIANYGYTDGSGDWYIIVDSGKCDGCGKCVDACPVGVLEVITDDYDDLVVSVRVEHKKSIKYDCGPCIPVSGERDCKCEQVCEAGAIKHSW